jgi:hypothetical protein
MGNRRFFAVHGSNLLILRALCCGVRLALGVGMTGHEKLAKINTLLAEGRTITISTRLRGWSVTQRDVERFSKIGRALLKATDKSLYLSVGKRYDCIDGCRFTVSE